MTSNDDDDDFSPEDAFNMFTPIIYRPGSRDHLNVPAPPQLDDEDDFSDVGLGVTLDTSLLAGVTLSGADDAHGGGPPPDLLSSHKVLIYPLITCRGVAKGGMGACSPSP